MANDGAADQTRTKTTTTMSLPTMLPAVLGDVRSNACSRSSCQRDNVATTTTSFSPPPNNVHRGRCRGPIHSRVFPHAPPNNMLIVTSLFEPLTPLQRHTCRLRHPRWSGRPKRGRCRRLHRAAVVVVAGGTRGARTSLHCTNRSTERIRDTALPRSRRDRDTIPRRRDCRIFPLPRATMTTTTIPPKWRGRRRRRHSHPASWS